MYNVLFPSGWVLEFGTIEIATIYVTAYNGSLLPEIVVDNAPEFDYNGFVLIDEEVL